ncbi:phosphoribosylanthranilate isomerase [bacterium]
MKIKICGITNELDAKNAVSFGVDMLGFNLYEGSPRAVELDFVKKILKHIPKNVLKVGVFVNEDKDILHKIADKHIFDVLQLHGDEPPSYCEEFKKTAIFKAFRLTKKKDLKLLSEYKVNSYLLDTYKEGKWGGTGNTFNWDLAKLAVEKFGSIILSGGLNPENAAQAVRIVKPWAVDVCSGVESSPGKKDKKKMKAFIEAVRKGCL